MAEKKTKKTASKKTASKKTAKSKSKAKKTKSKKSKESAADSGLVVIEDDLQVDKNAELEARKAYLEEARSQEAFD